MLPPAVDDPARCPLILHGGALGDLVLTLVLAARVEPLASTRRIELCSRADIGDLSSASPAILRRSPELLRTHELYGPTSDAPAAHWRPLVAERMVLSALGGPQSAVARRLEHLGTRRVCSIDPRPVAGRRVHIVDQWARQASDQGLTVAPQPRWWPKLPDAFPTSGRRRVDALAGQASVRIVIHPGSGGRAKCWSPAGFCSVAARCRAAGWSVAFVIGEVELESWTDQERKAFEQAAPCLTNPAPSELLALLAGASAFVGNDSGPTHLAAWIGTPTIAVFGPTDPHIWRPSGRNVTVLCGDKHANDWGITPSAIVAALQASVVGGGCRA